MFRLGMTVDYVRGFTFIELLISLTIIAIVAGVAIPMAEVARQRMKEQELRSALQQIRKGLDDYKRATEEGRVRKAANESGYPRNLAVLVEGVDDAKNSGSRIFFLRRIPRDPMHPDFGLASEKTWGLRSYASTADEPKPGDDVFDIFTTQDAVALDGTRYRDW